MSDLVVIAPVLNRPHRAQLLADSLHVAAVLDTRLVFVCSPHDTVEIAAVRATGADVLVATWDPGRGDWSKKINYAYRHTQEPYLLLAADDLHFHKGFDIAMVSLAEHGYGVVGCSDAGNPTVKRGDHSTHPLVARAYADEFGTIDEPGLIVHEGYRHNCPDVELVETAKARRQWAFTRDAVVEHLHPFWRKGDDDATYALGREGYHEDRRLYQHRRVLWAKAAA